MGFFSDLKEDLSQAVNELIPEEAEMKEMENAQETLQEPSPVSSDVPEEAPDGDSSDSDMSDTLESLLEQIDKQEQAQPAEPKTPSMSMSASFGSRSVSDEVAVVTAGMKVKGDMTSDGSLEVIGTIEGNIDIMGKLNITGTVTGNSKATEIYAENAKITGEVRSDGSVKIGQSSVIIGNIFANSAVIAGAVKGDIDVHGPVILDTSAIVMGNIKSKSVQINNGAVIEGMCSQCYADVNPTSFFEEFKKRK
ncbi:MAG: polymer-forming cytoskeletal protein [Lachnospiraceae bacterium]|nr:polymer-forming cytoskeletal protein [Lachnospiraceae bacterium]